EILISLAIVAVLFVVVALILPSSRHLSADIETNRKMTIVYDTLNSPRRLKDWNPIALRDPKMQWQYSGPDTGVGATASYKSAVVGDGSWKITRSEPGKLVEYAVTDNSTGTNKKMTFLLKPTGRNNRNVQIIQTYDVDYGFDIMGRYRGMYVSRNVGDVVKVGLNKLTNMLAGVPNYDYSTFGKDNPDYAAKIVDMPAENLLFASAAVARDNDKIQQAMQNNLQWINKVIAGNGLESAGPVRVITTEFGADAYSFDVAIPVRAKGATDALAPISPKLEGPVQVAHNDASRAVAAGFKGHMASLPQKRDALRAWAMTHGYETTGRPFETWNNGVDQGFTEDGEFTLYWTLK
ncbi:MAG TPA: SRPBCC family protein, partial [Lysobacter sp.]|nr:SRPBCC family protein [Lysobacter sp.]